MKIRRFFQGAAFKVRNLPGIFRKFRFWIIVALFLLLLLALGPWVDFLTSILRGFWQVFLEPIVTSPVGRFVAVNLIAIVVVVILYRRFKGRGRRLVGSWALDRFLSGMLHLASGRVKRASRCFEAVLKVARWIDLATAVPVYPGILPVARIKLALCYRELGDIERAMKTLELIRPRELSPALTRDLAEAKAFVYSRSAELMDETIDREIQAALKDDPGNPRLLRLARERAEESGDMPAAIDAQKRVLKVAPKARREEERARLARLHARNAVAMRRQGRTEEALAEVSRSRSYDSTLPLPNLLAGDIAAERGDLREAVREWARTPSMPGLSRIRGLLREGRLGKAEDLAFLVNEFPRSGILLVLAEHYLENGDSRRARNCLRKCTEIGFENRHTARLMARLLRAEGDTAGAERLEWRALKGFLGMDSIADSVGPRGPNS